MRASHVAYMNDGSELEFAFNLLTQQLRERLELSAASRARDLLAALLANIDTQSIQYAPVFVLCFSTEPNLLSQWQAYTPHGRGVSIGFDHTALILRAVREGWNWNQCKYDPPSHKTWMTAILDRLLTEADECSEDMLPWEAAGHALKAAESSFFSTAAMMKHSAFKAEAEWRLISPPIMLRDSRVKFGTGKTTLIPYIDFELCDSECPRAPVVETWIGPTTNFSHTEAVVNSIRWKSTPPPLGPIVIKNSGIPYRQI